MMLQHCKCQNNHSFPHWYDFKVLLGSLLQLSVRRKNTKEMFGGFLKSVVKSADEVLFSGVKVR